MSSSSNSVSPSSSTCHGRLIYGVRRLRTGAKASFAKDFEAWLQARPDLPVALAFPDPSDDDLLHLLVWDALDDAENDVDIVLGPESDAFAKGGDADAVVHVYEGGERRGGDSGSANAVSRSPSLIVHRHASLAGYMRPKSAIPSNGLPLIGVFRRAIRPGAREDLARGFQRVCDIWHATVPGILAAAVSPDPDSDELVHDLRIFADKASYDAHVDKSNQELTAAMEEWFSHYNTSVPHKGIMVAEDTSDPAMRTSSIKDKPVKVDFNVFHYGQGGCMGRCRGVHYF